MRGATKILRRDASFERGLEHIAIGARSGASRAAVKFTPGPQPPLSGTPYQLVHDANAPQEMGIIAADLVARKIEKRSMSRTSRPC